ncbi:hypothetical protein LguiA_021413 [Lonicera macranthoides]
MLVRDLEKQLTVHEVLCHSWVQVSGTAPDKPFDSAILSRLKKFSVMNKFKKMALRGNAPFVSSYGFHQLHILIFMLVVFHVKYCILTMALGKAEVLCMEYFCSIEGEKRMSCLLLIDEVDEDARGENGSLRIDVLSYGMCSSYYNVVLGSLNAL